MPRSDQFISAKHLLQKSRSDPAYIQGLLSQVQQTYTNPLIKQLATVFRGSQNEVGKWFTDWTEFSPFNRLTINQINLGGCKPSPMLGLLREGRPTSGITFFVMIKQEGPPGVRRLLDKGGVYIVYDPVNAAYRIACPNSLPTIPILTSADQQALDLFKPLLTGI